MPKKWIAMLIVGGALALLATKLFQIWFGSSYALPDVADIADMKATYYEREGEDEIKFQVPRPYWGEILNALLPAQLDRRPAAWVVLGQLDITLENGRLFVVRLFSVHPGPGAFASGKTFEQRVYYRGGETAKLKEALKAAYEATLSQPDEEKKTTRNR
jgi:hypothetical protein